MNIKNFKLLLWVFLGFLGGDLDIEKYQDYPRYPEVLIFFEKKEKLSFAERQTVVCFLVPSFLKVCKQYYHLKMKKNDLLYFLNWKKRRKNKIYEKISFFSKLLLGQNEELFEYENLSYEDLVVLEDILTEYLLSEEKEKIQEKFRNEFFKRVKTTKPES